MDLSKLTPTESSVNIYHPADDNKLLVTVTMMSLDDARMRPVRRAINNDILKKRQAGKFLSDKDREENELTAVIAAMTGWVWHDDANWHGEKPEFNEENARDVLTSLPWFYKALTAKFDEEKDFFMKLPKD